MYSIETEKVIIVIKAKHSVAKKPNLLVGNQAHAAGYNQVLCSLR